jgi:hypothetical protein
MHPKSDHPFNHTRRRENRRDKDSPPLLPQPCTNNLERAQGTLFLRQREVSDRRRSGRVGCARKVAVVEGWRGKARVELGGELDTEADGFRDDLAGEVCGRSRARQKSEESPEWKDLRRKGTYLEFDRRGSEAFPSLLLLRERRSLPCCEGRCRIRIESRLAQWRR